MFNIFKLFINDSGAIKQDNGTWQNITCKELTEKAQELQIRILAFEACVNLLTAYVAASEFKTYRERKEIFEAEFYLWNIEPNINQNKTAFINKFVRQLCANNEALIISARTRKGVECLAIADSFNIPAYYTTKQNEYQNVVVGDTTYTKTFREDEVLHVVWHENNIKPVVDLIYQNYQELMQAAENQIKWSAGRHLKVHVASAPQGDEEQRQKFISILENQIKPFLNTLNGVLPEFDGYKYEDMSRERASSASGETVDLRHLVNDIFDFTAMAFGFGSVLIKGTVENTEHAEKRLFAVGDKIAAQLEQEINRKRYGFEYWQQGTCLKIDTSRNTHFDLFGQAAQIEKLVGSGYSVNEIRRAAGQDTINEPWADEHFLTKNIGLLADATSPGA